MKRTFLIASVVVAISASSCSKTEVVQTKPADAIAFRPFTQATVKATEVTRSTLSAFTVHATSTVSTSYSFVDTYSTSDQGTTWVPALGQHYWPSDENETVKFVAYSALGETDFNGQPTVSTEAGLKITGIKPNIAAADQTDLVAAYTESNATSGANGVALNFQHALSQIVIQAKNSNSKVMKVEVYGVKIGRVNGTGTLTLPTTSTASDNGGLSWETNTLASYMAGGPEQSPVVLTATPAQDEQGQPTDIMFGEGSFMLLPQTLTQWNGDGTAADNSGSYISVLCKVYNNNSSSADAPIWTKVFPASDKPGFLSVPIGTTWEPGKKYTYTLEFYGTNGGGGTPDPDPIDPTDPDGGGVDPDPVDPVGGEITFTVTVADWLSSSDINTPMP